MSAQVTITSLPTAGPITGTESVPIVQNGVTVQTTTGAISASPSQNQTFLTVNQELTLPNSRYLSTNGSLSLTDGGPTSFYRIGLNGAAASLQTAAGGIIVKDSGSTVVARSMAASGDGLSVSNADGTGGNPTFQLTGIAAAVAALTGTGMLALTAGGTSVSGRNLFGTTDQINVANGDGALGSPTFSIANDAVFPGTGAITVPIGTTAQQPSGVEGQVRYNSDILSFEGYSAGAWRLFSLSGGVISFSGGLTGLTPAVATGGAITLGGILNVSNGGTGANSLTGYVKGSGTSAFTANATIPSTDVTGLGTMSTQNASSVAITGGTASGVAVTGSTVNSTTIGALTPAAGTFTSVAMTTGTISTLPTNNTDIVNKEYADAIASGINFHQACRLATSSALPVNTYNNGALGVGATLTANANGALSVDGVAVVVGNRILVKNEVNQAYNGVYTVTQTGSAGAPYILTRATDFDSVGSGVDQIDAGDFFLITAGTTLANTSWVQQTPQPITIGATGIVFAQFAAPITYTAGTGLNESPSYTFNIANTGVTAATYGSTSQALTLGVNAQGQITSASAAAIAVTSGQVSGLAASATTDTTNASNITSGTLPTGRMNGSYTGITGVGTLAAGVWNGTAIDYSYGGTGLTATPTNGQLAIGNGAGYTLANLTAGTNVSISNTAGGITISATPSFGGTVTSVDGSGGTTGLTLTGGPVTTSGTLTLGGTLVVSNGGTGTNTLTGYVKGTGTTAMTASTTIPNTDITGLGTMSTQAASAVAITGGTIDGASVGATTASTVRATSVTVTGLTASKPIFTDASNVLTNTGTVDVVNGGTGVATLTGIVKGNGTSAFTAATAGTDYVEPGTATTFTAAQSFPASGILLKGSSTGYTTFASANASATAYTVTFPAETMTVGFRNVPPVGTKAASYTLGLADVGKYVQITTGGSIIIPNSVFSEGDAVSVFNNTTAAITITCTITTAYISGINTDKATVSLATRGIATIFFISGTICVISGSVS